MILKNCPICGGKSRFHVFHRTIEGGGIYTEKFNIECCDCKIQTRAFEHRSQYVQGDFVVLEDGYGKAAEFWNCRVGSLAASKWSAEEMELVNSYSRRYLNPDEVYLFTVVLCNNDIDKDNERFSVDTLYELKKLFVGKTGFVNTNDVLSQTARIISCGVEAPDGKRTKAGDQLFNLTARVFMVRSNENAEIIQKIESGELTDVSIGCSVNRTICSICGEDVKSPLCNHQKGSIYDGETCYHILIEPTDAYEFGFVETPHKN